MCNIKYLLYIILNFITCVELNNVLNANIVAQFLTVDELSNVPCVSINNITI